MMQRWTTVALLGAALAGCQVASRTGDGEPSEAAQALTEDPCGLIDLSNVAPYVPKPIKYSGKPLPLSDPDMVWVIMPTDPNGVTEIGRVSLTKQEVVDVYDVGSATLLGQFITFITAKDNAAQAVYPGHPNPPPPVIDPKVWYAYARAAADAKVRAAQSLEQAQK